jgi:hypothetical protein
LELFKALRFAHQDQVCSEIIKGCSWNPGNVFVFHRDGH